MMMTEYTTDPELIFEKWQNLVDMVIDGGYGDNVGSTIIDLSGRANGTVKAKEVWIFCSEI
jgi:tRNA A37 threonylcarbamoyladenosine synthetase subunit TsaC/SUA5/YrdC